MCSWGLVKARVQYRPSLLKMLKLGVLFHECITRLFTPDRYAVMHCNSYLSGKISFILHTAPLSSIINEVNYISFMHPIQLYDSLNRG